MLAKSALLLGRTSNSVPFEIDRSATSKFGEGANDRATEVKKTSTDVLWGALIRDRRPDEQRLLVVRCGLNSLFLPNYSLFCEIFQICRRTTGIY